MACSPHVSAVDSCAGPHQPRLGHPPPLPPGTHSECLSHVRGRPRKKREAGVDPETSTCASGWGRSSRNRPPFPQVLSQSDFLSKEFGLGLLSCLHHGVELRVLI